MDTRARYYSVDALRGLIMILMAIDHSSAAIAREHGSEFWAGAMSSYTGVFPFLTRWVTHLCAPGFFFLMGAGIYWSSASSLDAGNDRNAAVRRTAWRGIVLLLVAQLVELPIMLATTRLAPPAVTLSAVTAPPPNDGSALYWGFITLSGLGFVMIACAPLLRLPPWTWLVVSALCVFATNTLLPASGQPGAWWNAVILAPGIAQHILAIYPVIPWLAGAAAGMYFARWWSQDPGRAARRVWIPGVLLLAFGLALRAAGGWGNIRIPRDAGWIEFLNNVKYPPSLVFWSVFLGLDLLLLALLARAPRWATARRSPLTVFGQAPLFFYVLHFALLVALAFAFFRTPGSLHTAWLVWALILPPLYFLCDRYRDFKFSKPRESLWRLF